MKFKQILSILVARWWIMFWIFFCVTAGGIALNYMVPKQYQASATILLDAKSAGGDTQKVASDSYTDRFLRSQVALITSYSMAVRVVESMGLDKSTEARQLFYADGQGKGSLKGWLADTLLKKLEVRTSSDSNVIEIQFTSPDPRLTSSVANAFVQSYIKTMTDNQNNTSKKQLQLVQRQLTDLRDSMDGVEKNINELQQRDEYIGVEARFETENKRLAELRSRVAAAGAATAESVMTSLRSELDAQQTKVNDIKSLRTKLKVLQSHLEVMQRSYDFAMQKFWQESFNERPELLSVYILKAAATPDDPALPKLWINFSLALLIGLLLGAGTAIAVEGLDRRIRSELDVTYLLNLPVLATVAV